MRKLINSIASLSWLALAIILPMERLDAAAYAPEVTLSIRTQSGEAQELKIPESGLGTFTLKNGLVYGFRPTMHDDKGAGITVTIFDMNSTPVELAQAETGVGKPAVTTKTTPGFTIKVGGVTPNVS